MVGRPESLIRTYSPKDVSALVELSNLCLAPYAGWVKRTPEYWQWSIMARPGVEPEDVLIMELDGQIVGFGALGPQGDVLDFGVHPLTSERPKRVAQLVCALEARARARNLDAIAFSLPITDTATDQSLRECGYVVERNRFLGMGILNPQTLIKEVLSARLENLARLREKLIVLTLAAGQDPFLLMSRLLIRVNGGIEVDDISDADTYPQACVIATDLSALTELILGAGSLSDLIRQGRIRIEAASYRDDALTLLEALIIQAEWYVPYSDAF